MYYKINAVRSFNPLSSNLSSNLDVSMFVEDIYTSITPVQIKQNKNIKADIVGSQEDKVKAIKILESICSREYYDNVVLESIAEIARIMAWEGCAVFEIIKENEIELHGFTSRKLIKTPFFYVQVLPSEERKEYKKRYVFMPENKIWYLEMPKPLGPKNKYLQTLIKLKRYDHLSPSFVQRNLALGKIDEYYNYTDYNNEHNKYLRRATVYWGWNRRDYTQKNNTEYYFFYKTLTFRWAQALLREHIINEINKLFVKLDMKCTINIGGIPNTKNILDIREEMSKGKISFLEAHRRTSF